MRLNIEQFKEDSVLNMSELELEQYLNEQEAAAAECQHDAEEYLKQLSEICDVINNSEALKSTIESYGVSEDVMYMADMDGGVCSLLESEELPELTEDNREDIAGRLVTSLEASMKGAWDKVKRVIKNIVDSLRDLMERILDVFRDRKKQIGKVQDKLSSMDEFSEESLNKPVSSPVFRVYNIDFTDRNDPNKIKETLEVSDAQNLISKMGEYMQGNVNLFKDTDGVDMLKKIAGTGEMFIVGYQTNEDTKEYKVRDIIPTPGEAYQRLQELEEKVIEYRKPVDQLANKAAKALMKVAKDGTDSVYTPDQLKGLAQAVMSMFSSMTTAALKATRVLLKTAKKGEPAAA